MLEGRAAIHRALPRLEKGTNTNLVKLNEIQHQVLQLGWNNPGQLPCRKGPGSPGEQAEGEPLLQRCPAESKLSPVQHLGGHIWTQIQFQGPHNTREMPTNWRQPEEQGHVTAKERWRELGLLSLEKEKPQEESDGSFPLPKERWGQGDTDKMEPDLSQRRTVKNKSREYSVQCSKGILIGNKEERFHEERSSTRTGAQRRCGNLHPWEFPKFHMPKP